MAHQGKPTLCLNMIVKNESKIITRLMESVVSIIDCYCICDTGSTDNTKELIVSYFNKHNIPGKIVDKEFVNFSHNRNFALDSCMGMSDFILLLDADMVLNIPNTEPFNKDILIGDVYSILQGTCDFYYSNIRIIRNKPCYRYVGVTHEYLSIPSNQDKHQIQKSDLFINDIGDGGSKDDKFARDIRLLTNGLIEEPSNSRYCFYLANSYYDSGDNDNAILTYNRRIKMDGWEQEVWYCYYRVGLAYMRLFEPEKAIYSWLSGFDLLPFRIENLYEIIKYYRILGKNKMAYFFYSNAKDILDLNVNRDTYLFLNNDVYRYKLAYEYSIIASYNGISNINKEIVTILNECTREDIITSTFSNMKYYTDILSYESVVDFSNKITKNIDGRERIMTSSSACIIHDPKKHGQYIMNMRYVNYRIGSNGEYHDCNDKIITLNKRVIIDSKFKCKEETWLDYTTNDKKYIGLEDIRIFNCDSNIIFMGTGCRNDNTLGINYGEYNMDINKITDREITPLFVNTKCEKNWVFIPSTNETNELPNIIHSWFPLRICSLNREEKSLVLEREITNLPNIFKYMRGSTSGVNIDGELWFIVHVVSYETPRHYYHCFVIFDDSMTSLLRYSAPFKFGKECIEYCLGFIATDTSLLVTYSTMDSSTMLATYDKEYINQKCVFSNKMLNDVNKNIHIL